MIEKIKLICEKIRLMESKIITTDHAFPNLAVWLEETYDEKLTSPVEVILDHWEIWVVSHVHDNEDQHGRSFYKRLNEFVFDIYKFKIKQFKGKIMGLFSKIKNFFRPKKEIKTDNRPRTGGSSVKGCSSSSRHSSDLNDNLILSMAIDHQSESPHTSSQSHHGSHSHHGNHSCSDHSTNSGD